MSRLREMFCRHDWRYPVKIHRICRKCNRIESLWAGHARWTKIERRDITNYLWTQDEEPTP